MITIDFVTSFAAEGLKVSLLVAAPMLGFGLAIGLLISIFQAVTSIQEMTLTFIPKIVGIMVAILVFAPWMLETLINFTSTVIINIPTYIR